MRKRKRKGMPMRRRTKNKKSGTVTWNVQKNWMDVKSNRCITSLTHAL